MTRTARVSGAVASVCALALLQTLAAPVNGATAQRKVQPKPAHTAGGHRLQIINVDLDFKPKVRPQYGKLRGFDPVVATVHMGDKIQFVNVDDTEHTASGFALTGQVAPAHYHFAGDPTVRKGRIIDAHEWSTGNLRAHGGKSQVFVTKNPGNYYFGCAYHLGQDMRGVIVVK
jgi:plastocyanin